MTSCDPPVPLQPVLLPSVVSSCCVVATVLSYRPEVAPLQAIVASPTPSLPVPAVVHGTGRPFVGLRVLVVDDEATNRRLCQRMLQRLGCEVSSGGRGGGGPEGITLLSVSYVRRVRICLFVVLLHSFTLQR